MAQRNLRSAAKEEPGDLQSSLEEPIVEIYLPDASADLKEWFNTILNAPCQLKALLSSPSGNPFNSLMVSTQDFLTEVFCTLSQRSIQDISQKDLANFFKRVLERLLYKERAKYPDKDLGQVVQKEGFIRSLIACCLETYLYVQRSSGLLFEDLLQILRIHPFDFWRQINNFANFQPDIPRVLQLHLKKIEDKILTNLAWQGDSPLSRSIQESAEYSDSEELNHASFHIFFRRVLTFVACRVFKMCSSIGLSENIQEQVWEAMKFFLSESTEHLQEWSIDCIIICMLFAVCKLKCEIPFINIVNKYKEVILGEGPINMQSGEYKKLNKFYNNSFILLCKDFLLGHIQDNVPRISQLNPKSPLRENLPVAYTLASPSFLTPRTEQLWDFGQKPAPKPKRISFDAYAEPIKKFKLKEEEQF